MGGGGTDASSVSIASSSSSMMRRAAAAPGAAAAATASGGGSSSKSPIDDAPPARARGERRGDALASERVERCRAALDAAAAASDGGTGSRGGGSGAAGAFLLRRVHVRLEALACDAADVTSRRVDALLAFRLHPQLGRGRSQIADRDRVSVLRSRAEGVDATAAKGEELAAAPRRPRISEFFFTPISGPLSQGHCRAASRVVKGGGYAKRSLNSLNRSDGAPVAAAGTTPLMNQTTDFTLVSYCARATS